MFRKGNNKNWHLNYSTNRVHTPSLTPSTVKNSMVGSMSKGNPLRKYNQKELSPTSINISNSGTISRISDNKISVISDRHYPKVLKDSKPILKYRFNNSFFIRFLAQSVIRSKVSQRRIMKSL